MPCALKQQDPSGKCYYCVQDKLFDTSTRMSPNTTDDQIKHDLITGYSNLQGLGCKQAANDNIAQKPDEPWRSYIVRYSRLFKLLNGTAPNDIRMRTTSMHFVNFLHSYLSSKVENRFLGMNERTTPWEIHSRSPWNVNSK